MSLGDVLGPHARAMRPADERAARAAMGIEDEATIIPMDMSRSPLFVIAQEDDSTGGLSIAARSTLSRRASAAILRQVAEAWEADGIAAGEPEPREDGDD